MIDQSHTDIMLEDLRVKAESNEPGDNDENLVTPEVSRKAVETIVS